MRATESRVAPAVTCPTCLPVSSGTPCPTLLVLPTATPYPTLTDPPTALPLPTYTSLPSATPHPTYTPLPTGSPYPTYTLPSTATPWPTHSALPSATQRPTYTPLPTGTPFPTHTDLPTHTPRATYTRYPTHTALPSSTPSLTPSPTPQLANITILNTLEMPIRVALRGASDRDLEVGARSVRDYQIMVGLYDWLVVRERIEECGETGDIGLRVESAKEYRLVCEAGKDLVIGFEGTPAKFRIRSICFFTCAWEIEP